jgi:hypothetical protein
MYPVDHAPSHHHPGHGHGHAHDSLSVTDHHVRPPPPPLSPRSMAAAWKMASLDISCPGKLRDRALSDANGSGSGSHGDLSLSGQEEEFPLGLDFLQDVLSSPAASPKANSRKGQGQGQGQSPPSGGSPSSSPRTRDRSNSNSNDKFTVP